MIHDSSKGSALISLLHHITAMYSSFEPYIIIMFLNLVLKSLQPTSLHDPCLSWMHHAGYRAPHDTSYRV